MANLIPDSEKVALKEIYNDFFDTFKRQIVIHKEAKKVINQINTSFLFGYGETSNQVNYAYEPESSTFYAIVLYPKQGDQDLTTGGDIRASIPEGEIRIKVNKEVKEYLTGGRTVERIDIGDHSYQLIGVDAQVNHFFSDYYIFKLKETA